MHRRFHVVDADTQESVTPEQMRALLDEDWVCSLVYADGWAVDEEGLLMLCDTCGNYRYCPEGRFEIVWEDDHANP